MFLYCTLQTQKQREIEFEAINAWPTSHLNLKPYGCRNSLVTVEENSILCFLYRKTLPLDIYQWDVCNLPLKSNRVDVFVTDLPFGKKSGSKHENWTLYPKALKEMARVCSTGSGRARELWAKYLTVQYIGKKI